MLYWEIVETFYYLSLYFYSLYDNSFINKYQILGFHKTEYHKIHTNNTFETNFTIDRSKIIQVKLVVLLGVKPKC